MAEAFHPPIAWPPHADRPAELPVVPREYHEFYRTPRLRWWHPLAALGMFVGLWLALNLVLSVLVLFYEFAQGTLHYDDLVSGQLTVTPALFLVNNLGLAAAIPLAWAAHRVVFGQRAGWLFSIVGRFRWGLLGRFLLIACPFYLVAYGIEVAVSGLPDDLGIRPETWFLLASVLLTTPLQSAGEEVAMRGLMARSLGSWFGASRVGLVVSTAITSVVFMVVHGAGDPWLNLYYFYFGVVASVLVWRTGGLEAPIAMHVVNNLVGLSLVPFTGVGGLFDREAGTGSPLVLTQMALITVVAAVMLWRARRWQLPQSAAPAASGIRWNRSGQIGPGPDEGKG